MKRSIGVSSFSLFHIPLPLPSTNFSMRSTILASVTVATVASAAAVDSMTAARHAIIKRQSVTTGASDAVVLNFALTLEHLESKQLLPDLIRLVDDEF